MSDLEPVTREEKLLDGQDLEPITRKEKFIKRIYDKTQIIPEPVTREEYFLKKAGEGGGGDVTIEQLNVSENGTYSEEGKAYSPVVVNVPSAVLGSLSVTENGTYTPPSGVDGYNEVNVNVPLPQNALLLKDIPSTPTAIATFSDGAEMVMPSLTVGVDAWQEGSGDPSPSNVRPIHGWDEVNISVSDVNIWDEEWELGGISTTNGQDISLNAIRSNGYSPCKPSTAYYARFTNDGYVFWYDADKNYISNSYSGASMRVVQSPSNANYFRIRKDGITTYNNDISINYPSTATTYEPYNEHTYTIPFTDTQGNPITVYGGELDVVSGVMTVDRIKTSMPANWTVNTESSTYWLITNTRSDAISVENTDTSIRVISDGFKGISANEMLTKMTTADNINSIALISSNRLFLKVAKADYPTLQDLYSMIQTNNIQVVYELATPLTIQLTPTAIKSLEGDNNVFADSGEILDGEYLGGVS